MYSMWLSRDCIILYNHYVYVVGFSRDAEGHKKPRIKRGNECVSMLIYAFKHVCAGNI